MTWTDSQNFIHFEQYDGGVAPQDVVDRMFPNAKPLRVRIRSTDSHDAEAQQMTDALNWVLKESGIRLPTIGTFTDKPADWEHLGYT